MRVIVTRNTFIGGVLVQASPTPIEVDAVVGKQLIGLGKATVAPNLPSEPVAAETPTESEPEPKENKPKARGK